MNDRERIQRLLPIIEAYAQGLTIQFRLGLEYPWNDWNERGNNLGFTGPVEFYRIKPEPRMAREWWVGPRPMDSYVNTYPAYTFIGCGGDTSGLIHVREVLPEDD